MPVTAPTPQQPSPVEVAQWHSGQNTARQQYMAQMAQSQYGRAQAQNTLDTQQRQLAYNQGMNRRTFDDPYIGRGIFRSGIRGMGLNNFYTQAQNEVSNVQQQYLNQIGQFNLNDQMAQGAYDTTMQNLLAQEMARRAELATQIREIV